MKAIARALPGRMLCTLACLALLGPGVADKALAIIAVSGASPYLNCTADSANTQPGTRYSGAEVEPWVSVNPANSANLVVGWQQDRWSNGGARGLWSAHSLDGGASWNRVEVPGLTLCSSGSFQRASDPWVSIAPDGTAYFMSLAFNNDTAQGGGHNAMLVNRSTDGGVSWGNPIALIHDTDGDAFNDKNAMTADPLDSNYVYAVWDRLVSLNASATTAPATQDASQNDQGLGREDGAVAARERLRATRSRLDQGLAPDAASFSGPTWFARTTNGGASWEPARMIFNTGGDAQTIGNQVVVLPDGTVMNFFTHIAANGNVRVGYQASQNYGASFGSPVFAIPMQITSTGTRTPDALAPVRDGNILFDVAVDPANGAIYLVWQDGRWQGIDSVAFAMSTDRGQSWTAPVRINRTRPTTNVRRRQAFVPSVEVGPNGRVFVSYYDFRFDQSDGIEATDYWAISCDPAVRNCHRRKHWGSEIRLTRKSFDMLEAPVARGHFLGDYMGLALRGNRMIAVFGVTVNRNKTTIMSRKFR